MSAARARPQRTCIGCRAVRDKKDLVRVVHTPDDRFLLDAGGKLAGRGAYLCPQSACLTAALKRKSFDRAFRQSVSKETVAALDSGLNEYMNAAVGVGTPAESRGPSRDGRQVSVEAEDGTLDRPL